jgi:hypothetical protein
MRPEVPSCPADGGAGYEAAEWTARRSNIPGSSRGVRGYVIVYIQATFVKQISHLRLGAMI